MIQINKIEVEHKFNAILAQQISLLKERKKS